MYGGDIDPDISLYDLVDLSGEEIQAAPEPPLPNHGGNVIRDEILDMEHQLATVAIPSGNSNNNPAEGGGEELQVVPGMTSTGPIIMQLVGMRRLADAIDSAFVKIPGGILQDAVLWLHEELLGVKGDLQNVQGVLNGRTLIDLEVNNQMINKLLWCHSRMIGICGGIVGLF